MYQLPDKLHSLADLPVNAIVGRLPLEKGKGYPTGETRVYHCLRCGNLILSLPSDSIGCDCNNVFIDVDAGRVIIEVVALFEILELSRTA